MYNSYETVIPSTVRECSRNSFYTVAFLPVSKFFLQASSSQLAKPAKRRVLDVKLAHVVPKSGRFAHGKSLAPSSPRGIEAQHCSPSGRAPRSYVSVIVTRTRSEHLEPNGRAMMNWLEFD
jgi:hypothetical protein